MEFAERQILEPLGGAMSAPSTEVPSGGPGAHGGAHGASDGQRPRGGAAHGHATALAVLRQDATQHRGAETHQSSRPGALEAKR